MYSDRFTEGLRGPVPQDGIDRGRLDDIYKDARQRAKREVFLSRIKGENPYVPALEDILEGYDVCGEIEEFYEGMVVPERVVGTYDSGRNRCFSRSFMPLPKPGEGDFAPKWQRVYRDVSCWLDSRNRVELTEFMHDLYVVEGNKRVSVSKYLNIPEIGVKVDRIIPRLSNNLPEVDEYHRYLEFERRTGLKWIRFSPGKDFDMLDDVIEGLYGNDSDKYGRFMKDVFVPFLHSYIRLTKHRPEYKIGDVFLDFIEKADELVGMRPEKREKMIKSELKRRRKRAELKREKNGCAEQNL